MGPKAFKVALALFLLVALVGSTTESAITCPQVAGSLMPCLQYLRAGGAVPESCCSGIRSLNSAAQTTPDRRTACQCLKSAAGSIPGINLNLAAGLPKQCGVNIPYPISVSTDCNRVN